MSRIFKVLGVITLIWGGGFAFAQGFSGLARVDMAGSQLADLRGGLRLQLALSQGVPYRAYTLADPPRLVLDFREVDWSGLEPVAFRNADRAVALRYGTVRPGWSRMVVEMDGPYALQAAGMVVTPETGAARLEVVLGAVTAEAFVGASGAPHDPVWDLPPPATLPARPAKRAEGAALRVILDAGHGGIDPGAEREGLDEKSLMLAFARDLKEVLLRSGRFEVVMTRDTDEFVSLERRVALAHEARADVFLSLHADAVTEGQAHGAVVHLLSESASDEASALLAERHDRDELLAGVDLTGQDDVVAGILMDLARQETQPRAERLARALVKGITAANVSVNRKPLRRASFSVLKAADIPSVLLEVGFMSSPKDLENLRDATWRRQMAGGIRDALLAWQAEDAALSGLVRQ